MMNRMMIFFGSLILACSVLGADAFGRSRLGQEPAQADAAAEFERNIAGYAALRRKVAAGLPNVGDSSDPARTLAIQKELARGIRVRREGARQGDIFTPGVEALFRQLMRLELAHAENRDARGAVLGGGNPRTDSESATRVSVEVNADYPTEAPLSTVPPQLLARLPELPDDIEYRFVGRHLILRDARANLIVDFIGNAVPSD